MSLARAVAGRSILTGFRRTLQHSLLRRELPLHGYKASNVLRAELDALSDADLVLLNSMLEWSCFTTDQRGRRLGSLAWRGKRIDSQEIPDRRILQMHDRFGLAGRSVLEIGCFEGVHTIGLGVCGATVTAVDGRIENVVKTIVRANLYGFRPEVLLVDVDEHDDRLSGRTWDLLHHVGVLYHLLDPVRHLQRIVPLVNGLMLDTHVAESDQTDGVYEVDGASYRYRTYAEHGRSDPFSGLHDHAKWLALDDLTAVLSRCGFSQIDVAEVRSERNGTRVLVFASRG